MAEVIVYIWETPKGYRRNQPRKLYVYKLGEDGLPAGWVADWGCALRMGERSAAQIIDSEKQKGYEAFIGTDVPPCC